MLKHLNLCRKHQSRIEGHRTFNFESGLNTVIGPNGSGKSSLLKAIYECPVCERIETRPMTYRYFNSETMNPHVRQDGFRGHKGALIKVRAMFSSHGETMRDVLSSLKFESGDCLLFDEPETGQDIQWIIQIKKAFETARRGGCQIIIASHHPVFWQKTHLIELQKGFRNKTIRLMNSYLKSK